jgi:predicted metal-binding membrane protein
VWVAIIGIAVLVEKVAPHGDVVGRLAGIALIAAGLFVMSRALVG